VVIGQKLTVHHFGIAVPDIGPATNLYVQRFGYSVESPVIHDPLQTAYVQFLRLPGDHAYLEFVAPDSPQSKLAAFVKNGGGLNHICYGVVDIEAAVRELRATQMITLCEPVAAVAFPGRRIAWLLGRDRVPVELVEQGEPGQL
jgi:methylmalonyl-CoA/ethylmalonyl-CoA epimerase